MEFLERKFREYSSSSSPAIMVLAGVRMGSGISGDLQRGGLECRWMDGLIGNLEGENGIMTFSDVRAATTWIKHSEGAISLHESSQISVC